MKNKEFEVCIRAIIFKRNEILICKNKKKNYYFFPGGHINFGESIKEALNREIKEELGISINNYNFIGAMENIYLEEGEKHHEFNLVFKIENKRIKMKSKENHIDFILMDENKFSKEKVLPIALKKAILRWLKDKKIFWVSQIYNKTIL